MATLTEADVLFELFLPLLCETRAVALEQFRGAVQFHLRSTPPRAWYIKGGKRPWLQRGVLKTADMVVTLTEELVAQLVQGREPDLEKALADGHIGMHGNLKVLRSFELTMADAQKAWDVLRRR